jgi:hypothetical protein
MAAAADRMPRTLLIGIGAQKAGTNWLADYLAGHPQVFMSPIKELHFWNTRSGKSAGGPERRFRAWLTKLEARGDRAAGGTGLTREDLIERLAINGSIEAYLDFFRRRAGNEPVWCEITPAYSLLDRDDFVDVAAVAADVRFVFLLRNPADRYWSHLRFARRAKPDLDPYAAFRSRFDTRGFALRTNYQRVLEELHAVVDPSRVHLAFFERLFTQSEVDRFCDFLGVARHPADFTPVATTPGDEVMSEEMRALAVRHFAVVYRYIETRFAGDIPENWRKDIATYLD